jgi:hypothetical protein
MKIWLILFITLCRGVSSRDLPQEKKDGIYVITLDDYIPTWTQIIIAVLIILAFKDCYLHLMSLSAKIRDQEILLQKVMWELSKTSPPIGELYNDARAKREQYLASLV